MFDFLVEFSSYAAYYKRYCKVLVQIAFVSFRSMQNHSNNVIECHPLFGGALSATIPRNAKDIRLVNDGLHCSRSNSVAAKFTVDTVEENSNVHLGKIL